MAFELKDKYSNIKHINYNKPIITNRLVLYIIFNLY